MSRKNKFIIIIGVIVALMPLLGFPGAVRDAIIILTGLILIGGALWGEQWGRSSESFLSRHFTRHHGTFAENIPRAYEDADSVQSARATANHEKRRMNDMSGKE